MKCEKCNKEHHKITVGCVICGKCLCTGCSYAISERWMKNYITQSKIVGRICREHISKPQASELPPKAEYHCPKCKEDVKIEDLEKWKA